MRKLATFPLILLVSLAINAQPKRQIAASTIDKVTVFLQGAQVNRSAKASILPGKTELVFGNISPSIDKQSIQVKAEGKITVLSVNHQINFLKEQEAREEIVQVDQQKNLVQEKIAIEKNLLSVFIQEESLLLKNQDIKGDQSTLKASELREAADFQRLRLTEVYTRKTEIEKLIKKMEAELEKLNKQLKVLNEKKDQSTSEIIVSVSSKETTISNFTISYLVKNASWFPTYDVRVKDVVSPINIQYKANINQSSGEDWKEVKLMLSTGNPNQDGNKPNLQPWYLRYLSYTEINSKLISSTSTTAGNNAAFGRVVDAQGKPVISASIVVKGTNKVTTSNSEGFFNITIPAGNNTLVVSAVGMQSIETKPLLSFMNIALPESSSRLDEVVVTGFSSGVSNNYDRSYSPIREKKSENAINTTTLYQPTSTVYEIEEPYSIPKDGKQYMVEIKEYELQAIYQYYAVPKLNENAFLTAKLLDWQELNLIPGEANLFLEGNFLGKSILDIYNAGDTLELSLGMDKGVVVKRTMVKEFSQKRFLANNKIDARKFDIIVRNNKLHPINISVEDQFPISTSKEIEIDDKEAKAAKIDSETQKIHWQFDIEPKKDVKASYSYSVKYPKDKRLQLD